MTMIELRRGLACLIALNLISNCLSCTNLLVSPAASEDGSSYISYNADSGNLFGQLYHYPAKKHEPHSMKQIYDWDTGKYLGEIPEPSYTYNVVGNMNEFGLSIGETTFGGLSELQSQEGAVMDYGSLIWTTLQRSKTAREAIKTISELMDTYGYASEGESFSIADGKEVWVMDIIGKGNGYKGAVWVARKLPPGTISAHANQARITTFPLADPDTCLYASDVITFAREKGYYGKHEPDAEFSFSDTFDPVTFTGARFCEARVWNLFGMVMGDNFLSEYEDYASGKNLTNRMPLWVKPHNKLTKAYIMSMMRQHYEQTSLDMSGQQFKDVGATQSYNPNRVHPLTWSAKGSSYLNERPIATQQTGWNFVAQTRPWLLGTPLAGIIWFGVDDSATTVRVPIYSVAAHAPAAFAGIGAQDGRVSPMMKFDMKRAFYSFNLVANWAYSRWNVIYPDVLAKITSIEAEFSDMIPHLDEKAMKIFKTNGYEQAVEYLTGESDKYGNGLVDRWNDFFGELFVRYRDGYRITEDASDRACGCKVENSPYPDEWYDDIVSSTGDHYLVPPDAESLRASLPTSRSKLELLNRR